MINKEILKGIGLTENESEIYLILLKEGESTIYEIADHSKISRPNIYDIIKKLKEKGLVSSITKKNKKYFKSTTPENLYNILKEKESNLLEILPKLKEIYETSEVKPIIEVYRGVEGLKSLMNDMLKTKKEIWIFNGADKRYVLENIPEFYYERFLREKKKLKIKTNILYSKNIEPIKGPGYKLKKLPEDYFAGKVSYWTYGDRVYIGIWTKELVIIRIISDDVAKVFMNGIKLIWNTIK